MIGKVKPDKLICDSCLEVQIMCNVVDNCERCLDNKPYCKITFIEDNYAYVLNEGRIKRVSLDRLYDVKEMG